MIKLVKTSLLTLSLIATSTFASDILVTVNGKNITKNDAQAFINAQAPNVNFVDLQIKEKQLIVERLVEKQLFSELAAKIGVAKKPEFKRNMEILKSELLVNLWMKEQMDNVVVSDSEAKEYYEKNANQYIDKESMHARHILLKGEEDALKIIDTLKTLKGEALKNEFIALAKTKSTGPSGVKGGDLGTFGKDRMVPEFSNAAWALKSGEITTKPVKTKFGYHVIYLETKTEARPTPYENVKEQIIASLKQKQFTTKITEVASELKSKAKIVDMTQEQNTTDK